jgi:hypothetical protein
MKKFFLTNLFAYSLSAKGLFEEVDKERYYEIPIIFSGDLNYDLREPHGADLITFMRDKFWLNA